jgi:hypothetical protein
MRNGSSCIFGGFASIFLSGSAENSAQDRWGRIDDGMVGGEGSEFDPGE